MVPCCAHALGLRWRKNVDSGRGLRLTEFLFPDDWFFFFFFFFFLTLNGTRRLHLGESREISFSLFVVEIIALSARISLRQTKSSSFSFFPQTEEDRRASSPSSYPLSQQQASCRLICPSTFRHSKWRGDSYRIWKFSPFILDCMFQTKTGEYVPASLPQQFLLTLVGQNM